MVAVYDPKAPNTTLLIYLIFVLIFINSIKTLIILLRSYRDHFISEFTLSKLLVYSSVGNQIIVFHTVP